MYMCIYIYICVCVYVHICVNTPCSYLCLHVHSHLSVYLNIGTMLRNFLQISVPPGPAALSLGLLLLNEGFGVWMLGVPGARTLRVWAVGLIDDSSWAPGIS